MLSQDAVGLAPSSVAEPDLRPLKPLLPLAAEGAIWPLILGITAAGITALLLQRRRRRRRPAARTPPLTPEAAALAALAALAASEAQGAEARRQVFFDLSCVIRRYLEARFRLNATDLTSEEILTSLPSLSGLDASEALRLRQLFGSADAVKFAARLPAPEEIRHGIAEARRFVAATAAPLASGERDPQRSAA